MAASGEVNLSDMKECIACHVRSRPLIVRLQHGGILKGWHDISTFVSNGDEFGSMCEPGTKWLCANCTRGTLQCGKCMTRFSSIEQRCLACHPADVLPN
jgi:hypothetical protein